MNNVSHRRFDWFSLLIGILFILGGFLSFSRPDKTLHLLSVIIGVVFLFDGIFELTIRRRFLRSLGEGTGWIVGSSLSSTPASAHYTLQLFLLSGLFWIPLWNFPLVVSSRVSVVVTTG